MGPWGQNVALESLHVLVGSMFQGLNCQGIKTCVGLPIET
jgi:hypothetical protein